MAHALSRALRSAAAVAAVLACAPAAAAPNDIVTGLLHGTGSHGGTGQFTCFGTPTCVGPATITLNPRDGCTNGVTFASTFTINGVDLSHAGSFSGTVSISNSQVGEIHNPDGTCTYQFSPQGPWTYSATWDGTSGSMTVNALDNSGQPDNPIIGNFSAKLVSASPLFPMDVNGSIDATTTDVDATIQPRPQDAGTQQSVYVFTHAPSNLVSGAVPKAVSGGPPHASTKDDAVVCVLAQVTASGQLVAASASSMQAALSGVLSSQGQSVQLLNNVPTPNVAGATVFVGYGTSAAAMLSSGLYQAALTVPGAIQCTASLASAPAATSPAALSGLWYNASESGWGVQFTQRGKNLFAAWYTYDAQGNPKWYVAPNCAFANANATSGTCSGTLYQVAAGAFFGTAFNPNLVQATAVGTLSLAFNDTNNASMSYSVGGQSRTVPVVRQVFPVTATTTPAVDYTDLWWNPSQSGWGMAITQQFGNIFLAWYVYDANGKPFWYVAPACTMSGSGCSGTLYRTTGPPFGPPLDPTKVQAFAVGTAIVSFFDANNAVLSYTVDGASASTTITRQLF